MKILKSRKIIIKFKFFGYLKMNWCFKNIACSHRFFLVDKETGSILDLASCINDYFISYKPA